MKQLFFLAAGMFAIGCDDFVFAGLLPSIGASLQTSIAITAQGCTAFGIAFIVSAPICTFLLARQPVRAMLITALLIFIAGNGITLFSTHWMIYLISRCIAGLGAGLFIPIAIATGHQLVDPGSRGHAMSILWGANCAGAVIGVPLGLILADQITWRATIILIVILAVIAWVGIMLHPQPLRVENPPSIREQFNLLFDRRVLAVIGITLLTATGSLGLYAFIMPMLVRTRIVPEVALSFWNIGGLIGSIAIGYAVDHIGKPPILMACILVTLLCTIIAIPSFYTPVLGLLPFLLWGALGWATVTPQQYSLFELQPNHEATLVALNSSAVSLGSVTGTALGGLALSKGLDPKYLPYVASVLLLCASFLQIVLIQKQKRTV